MPKPRSEQPSAQERYLERWLAQKTDVRKYWAEAISRPIFNSLEEFTTTCERYRARFESSVGEDASATTLHLNNADENDVLGQEIGTTVFFQVGSREYQAWLTWLRISTKKSDRYSLAINYRLITKQRSS